MSRWCHPTILSSVIPFFFCLHYFLASESFVISQLFISGSQSIGASTSASVLAMNIQDWFPLGWTGCISLLSRGLSRVFSNTIVQKHQFFRAQLSLWSSSHIHTWLQEKPWLWLDGPLLASGSLQSCYLKSHGWDGCITWDPFPTVLQIAVISDCPVLSKCGCRSSTFGDIYAVTSLYCFYFF